MKTRSTPFLLALSLLALAAVGAAPKEATDPPVPSGSVFHFIGMRYLAGWIEFRDMTEGDGALFPCFWYEGKLGDVRGKMIFDPQNPKLNMVLTCNRLCQGDGAEYKILGETFSQGSDKPPVVRYTVKKIGTWLPASDAKDKKVRPYEATTFEGELDVDGRKVDIQGDLRVSYSIPRKRDGQAEDSLAGFGVNMTATFKIKGKDLNLKKVADRDIQVTVRSKAYSEATILEGTKKKTLQDAGVKPMD